MRSMIDKVVIVPTRVFEDRTIKCQVEGHWYGGLNADSDNIKYKGSRARRMAKIRATINPDNIFVDECEYYDEMGGWAVPIEVRHESRYNAIYCYSRNKLPNRV